MCGLVGYIGDESAAPILVDGLKRLEYRGYDSSGVALLDHHRLRVVRCRGKVSDLERMLRRKNVSTQGHIGLGHTRWATHGRPSLKNAHPHVDMKKDIALVHNGIIENDTVLRAQLMRKGCHFRSDTDTEVLTHLISRHLRWGLEEAVIRALPKIKGSYAIAVVSRIEDDRMIVACHESPLLVGYGARGMFAGSDLLAFVQKARRYTVLKNGDIGILTREGLELKNIHRRHISKKIHTTHQAVENLGKEGYPHFMLKEIHEQPRVIRDIVHARIQKNRVVLSELKMPSVLCRRWAHIVIVACGTSWHAGLIGRNILERVCHIPVSVEYAAEFRYREPLILPKHTLALAISQSGETADTLAAMRRAQAVNIPVLSIVNVVGSTMDRESDMTLYTRAGIEIGVASTKAFTSQLLTLYLLSLFMGQMRQSLSNKMQKRRIRDIMHIDKKLENVLKRFTETGCIVRMARKYARKENFLFLGRGTGWPLALEGALKLKEISYIHAEGYPAAEIKHGPIALIDKNMPVLVLALQGRRYEKIKSNIKEIKARGGKVIAIVSKGDRQLKNWVDDVIPIPDDNGIMTSIIAALSLQLLAYHIAVIRGCHVDQPRNLAKSVTVE